MLKVRAACLIGWLACVCLAAACSFDEHAKHCQEDSECAPGRCYQSFCISTQPDTSSSAQSMSDASSDKTSTGKGNQTGAGKGGSGGKSAADAGGGKVVPMDAGPAGACVDDEERPCLVNPEDNIAAESCNRGMQTCVDGKWGKCSGQPMPVPEVCNGRDDDCNGEADDLVEVCYPQGQPGCVRGSDGRWACTGACGTGTRMCKDGKLTECSGASVPAKDECTPNGMVARDEDCDQLTDEGCDCRSGDTHSCYSGRAGTMDVGKCKAGMQTCVNGAFGACMGEVLDEPETCANPKSDDDCNGKVDDVPTVGNKCVISGTQGPCGTGLLACTGTTGPSCVAAAMASAEVCNDLDDDCDGRTDETFNLRRDPLNCGTCGTRCATGQACCASSCVNTATSNNHCGACDNRCGAGLTCKGGMCMSTTGPMAGMPAGGAGSGGITGAGGAGSGAGGAAGGGGMPGACNPACGAGLSCCDGMCIDLKKDAMHCGTCQNACSQANPGCCDGACVDFLDPKNCGGCGKDCSALGSADVMCECVKSSAGVISCSGPVLNLCLL
ncbi:MAG TPA: hypothetical protein VFN67_40175 [Polyangiales bacterium]|nr:hypothetical protein [Polyangiales bacterium]